MIDDGYPQRVDRDLESGAWFFECDFCPPYRWDGFETLDDADDALTDHRLEHHGAGEPRLA